jgi:uncharacterized protein YuzE
MRHCTPFIIDRDAGAGYTRFSKAQVERTIRFEPTIKYANVVLVDYDANGEPVGVEIITTIAPLTIVTAKERK